MDTSQGLTTQEAQKRLQEAGRNELIRTSKVQPLKILLSQFSSPLILILIAAALISLGIGLLPGQESNTVDAVLILIIVLLSGIFGFVQDYEAEKTIEALQELSAPQAKVIRDGKKTEIPSAEVVPGDLLLLDAGDMVTADARLQEIFQLEVDESALTGESVAVSKKQDDLVFANTYITGGHARALVEQTGMHTRIGKVASRLQEMQEEKSSFQQELAHLSKTMALYTILIGVLIGAIGFFKFGLYNALLTAISLAVAAIPEGLPAVVVLALAVGARLMVRKNALIRKLSIVESIGAVDIICTDKTGTLTKNEMSVVRLYFDNQETELVKDKTIPLNLTAEMLFKCGMLCNNSTSEFNEQGELNYFGEQTEIALRKVSESFLPESINQAYHKINEIAFSSQRKMMSVLMRDAQYNYTVFSKGAPEVLLEKCSRIVLDGKVSALTPELKKTILNKNTQLAKAALRVLAFALKSVEKPDEPMEENLVFIGLQGMIDPPREEAATAVEECSTAGIRVIMITGDNPVTAMAIAQKVGLQSTSAIEGNELEQMPDEALQEKLKSNVNIFARTNPFHKLRILEALGKQHNVAMTGDGINDALALKRASVGIAMGKKGTEVAKQASDIVLLDDNFSTIKDAVKEGRGIFDNIRKFINYLLTCNFAEVAVIFLATLFFPLREPILYPAQLLWINLLTDGLVALALGVDPPVQDIMHKPPRKRNEPVIDKSLGWLIILIGIVKTTMLLLTFIFVREHEPQMARSTLFTAFVLYEFVRIATIRSQEKLTWLSNKWLLMALFISLLLQLLVVYSPLNQYFNVVPLDGYAWTVLLAGCVIGYILAILITKFVNKYIRS